MRKNKDGVVTRDKLTKHWTDWVDYWAVDFDYESRPEIIHEPRSIKTGEPLPGWQPGDEVVEFVPSTLPFGYLLRRPRGEAR